MPEKQRPAGQWQAADETRTSVHLKSTVTPLQPRFDDDQDPAVDVEGFKALLPEAWFEARYVGHATAVVFNAPKVFLHFEITELGAHKGLRVFRAFRVRRLKGRPTTNGAFTVHAGGELYSTLVRLLDVRTRADRVTLRPLRSMLFRIRLRTVTMDYRQRPLPEHSRYSTIDEIVRGE